jgi:hypothetical protein
MIEAKRDHAAKIGIILKIAQRITFRFPDISLQVDPKSHEQIDHHRRPHGKTGKVNEILPDSSAGYSHFLTKPGTNPENMSFDELPETVVHRSKLKHSCII